MTWQFRRSFVIKLTTILLAAAFLSFLPLMLDPQLNRFVYIYQSMLTDRGGPHLWAGDGPSAPVGYSGVWRGWHWNGKLSFEETFRQGQLDGPYKAWNKAGRLSLDTFYKSGQLDGKYLLFYDNGVLCRQQEYLAGKPISRWLRYGEDGTKLEECAFGSSGVMDGEQITWYKDGKMARRVWRKGQPWDGDFVHEKGAYWFRDTYESGTLTSSTNIGPIQRL